MAKRCNKYCMENIIWPKLYRSLWKLEIDTGTLSLCCGFLSFLSVSFPFCPPWAFDILWALRQPREKVLLPLQPDIWPCWSRFEEKQKEGQKQVLVFMCMNGCTRRVQTSIYYDMLWCATALTVLKPWSPDEARALSNLCQSHPKPIAKHKASL